MRYDFLMVALLFVVGAILLVLVIFSLTRRELMLGFILLGLLALANCIFLFGYGAFILSDSETAMLKFNHIQYLAIPFIYVLWYFISLQQRTRIRMLPANKIWLFLIIPVLAVAANMLYPWKSGVDPSWVQKLYFVSNEIISDTNFGAGFTTLIFVKGPMYYILMFFNMIMALLAASNYFLVYRKSDALYKRNLLALVIASLLFFVILIMTFINTHTASIDTSPLVTATFALLALFALYKYEFFDLMPFAYRQLFQGANYPIAILDKSKTFISANNSMKEMYNEKMDFREILTLKDFNKVDETFFSDLEKNNEHETSIEIKSEIKYYSVRLDSLNRHNDKHIGYLLRFIDITEHKREMIQMEKIAAYDDLTKILNRRVFYLKASEAFDEAVVNKKGFSFIMFDLDEFKDVNDIYGHQAGDHILTEMARLFTEKLDEADIFARYGGEEFIIYCPKQSPDEAFVLAGTLRSVLENNVFNFNKHKIKITASFGVSGSNRLVQKSFEHYIKDSDDGLYRAKNKGKNNVVIVR